MLHKNLSHFTKQCHILKRKQKRSRKFQEQQKQKWQLQLQSEQGRSMCSFSLTKKFCNRNAKSQREANNFQEPLCDMQYTLPYVCLHM